jgi:hypothetical protein
VTALLAYEECSNDLILGTRGAEPTLVSFLAVSSNILEGNVLVSDINTKNATYWAPHQS